MRRRRTASAPPRGARYGWRRCCPARVPGGPGTRRSSLRSGRRSPDLPRAFRTAELQLIHAESCFSRYSSWTCCVGVSVIVAITMLYLAPSIAAAAEIGHAGVAFAVGMVILIAGVTRSEEHTSELQS